MFGNYGTARDAAKLLPVYKLGSFWLDYRPFQGSDLRY